VDAVKTFVSQAIASIVSSLLLIFGASALLLWINWRLALAILGVVPFIFITFQLVLRKVRKLFQKGQEAIDWLNRIINESIRGASLIRLLNTQQIESQKFLQANAEARDIGLSVLRLFASLIPSITLATNVATVMILMLGGHYVIAGSMSLGNFTAFKQYLAILIFPIILIGFMSKVIAQASASYTRIKSVLEAPEEQNLCGIVAELRGDIAVENVSLVFGEKTVLKDVSFAVPAGTKTAIIGPTAAGKTQLLHLLIGLLKPSSGVVACDGDSYDKESLHRQVGFVFQDSVFFNLTLRENIAFSAGLEERALGKAITTAELDNFIDALPQGLETVVSERGASLSGGQKQRVMLARRPGAQSAGAAARRFHCARRFDNRTGHSRKCAPELSWHYPGFGDPEDCAGGRLRPDHSPDGGTNQRKDCDQAAARVLLASKTGSFARPQLYRSAAPLNCEIQPWRLAS
jgi:ATP-binding cassette subfamily B protein